MNLNKDLWRGYKLGDLVIIKGGKRLPKGKSLVNFNTGYPYIRVTDFEKNTINIQSLLYLHNEDYQKIKNYIIRKEDVFISIVGTIGLVGIIPPILDGVNLTENAARLIIRDNTKLDQKYLLYSLLSPNLQLDIKNNTGTTAQPKLGLIKVSNLEIPVPPLEEQKRIASLFQSIDTAVEQFDCQNEDLLNLQKALINGLLENNPQFGNILNESNTICTKFGEVANCIEQHDKEKKEVTRFIGLENIEPDNFAIENWGKISDGTTFTKRFNTGDVLFGKRRSYLKKVAVADFDGICSGDILVFRAKKEVMLPGLLPYYVASEAFIQHAVTTSAGSLSPRTKWKDLKEFEFSIPDLETQGMVLKVLNQVQALIKQFKEQKVTLKTLKQNLLNEILG